MSFYLSKLKPDQKFQTYKMEQTKHNWTIVEEYTGHSKPVRTRNGTKVDKGYYL